MLLSLLLRLPLLLLLLPSVDASAIAVIITIVIVVRLLLLLPFLLMLLLLLPLLLPLLLLLTLALLSLLLVPVLAISSTVADRLGLYMIALQVAVFGRLPMFGNTQTTRTIILLGTVAIYAAALGVWLIVGNFAKVLWLPYQRAGHAYGGISGRYFLLSLVAS